MHCLLLTLFLLPFVTAEHYQFDGRIIYRELSSPTRKKLTQRLNHIDHHVFPKATDIKVNTRNGSLIAKLDKGAVKNLPYLTVIRMPKCGIEVISPGAFLNLPILTSVYLQDNKIESIEEGIFDLPTLEQIFLQRNNIKTIATGAFNNLKNLRLIHLNKNRISEWNPQWFRNNPKLHSLYFRRNQIQELPPKSFANLKSSQKINGEEMVELKIFLSKNKIARLHPDTFQGLDSAKEIWLDRNKLEVLDKNLFSHMTLLEELHLQRNSLTEVDKNSFRNLAEMIVLDLGGNKVSCVPFEVVSLVHNVIVDHNDVDCDCIFHLRKKLQDQRINHTIYDDDSCAFD